MALCPGGDRALVDLELDAAEPAGRQAARGLTVGRVPVTPQERAATVERRREAVRVRYGGPLR